MNKKIIFVTSAAIFLFFFLPFCYSTSLDNFNPELELSLITHRFEAGSIDEKPFFIFLERCKKYNPKIINKYNLYLAAANLSYNKSHWKIALSYYKKADKSDFPLRNGIHYRMGQCSLNLKKYNQASYYLKQAIAETSLKSLKTQINFTLAELYQKKRKFKAQERILKRINRENKSKRIHLRVELIRAKTDIQRKYFKAAFNKLLHIFEKKPNGAISNEAHSLLLSLKHKKSCKKLFNQGRFLRIVGKFLYRSADYNNALTYLLKYSKRYNHTKYARKVNSLIGHCYYRQGNFKNAIFYYNKRLSQVRKKSDKAFYKNRIGRCYQKAGNYSRAIRIYNNSLKRYSRHYNNYTLLSLAYCYELTHQTNKALQTYKFAAKKATLKKVRDEAVFRQAILLFNKDKKEQALPLFLYLANKKKSLKKEAGHFWQIKTLYFLNEKGAAKKVAKKFLERYPTSVYFPLIKNWFPKQKLSSRFLCKENEKENYEILKHGKIDPAMSLDYLKKLLTKRNIFSKANNQRNLHLARLYRVYFDTELSLDYYVDYQRYHWKDASLLLTLVYFFNIKEEFHRSLYFADALNSLFDNGIIWNEIPFFIKRLFFPFPFKNIIVKEALENQLNKNLLTALILQESKFDQDVISQAGARGLMQLMPETAKMLAKKKGEKKLFELIHKLSNPKINIHYGSYYLKILLKRYKNNKTLALAAYNAGEFNVDKWKDLIDIPEKELDYSDIIAAIRYGETRNYVKKILINLTQYSSLYYNPNKI